MTNGTERYMYAGHAIGVGAQFHRLDEAENLNHVVPTLGASVIPVTGGRSQAHADTFRFEVRKPRRRCLLAVDRVDSSVEGRERRRRFETELSVDVVGLEVVEMLYIDLVRLHLFSSRSSSSEPVVTTQGNRIEGMRLGSVEARVTIDDEPLTATGTENQLLNYHQQRAQSLPKYGDYYQCSIVKNIQLIGSEQDKQGMSVVDGHIIVWKGFGRIILGEVHVKGYDRRLTLVRLAMGSSAGGSAAAGDGQSNGQPVTGP